MLIKFSKQIRNSFAKIINSEANSESCHTSKMGLFAKIANNEKPSAIVAKTCILDVRQGSEYASELVFKVKAILFLNQFEYQR